jgi:putative ABC transport system permease protein
VKRRKWFLHFLGCSIGQRKGRVAVASLSVMIAAAIVVCALGISLGIRQKLGGELKAYGANIIITPDEGYLTDGVLAAIEEETGVEESTGQLYAPVTVNGAEVELIGLDIRRIKEQGWKITGRWPEEGELLLGTNIRDALGLALDDTVIMGIGGPGGAGGIEKGMKVAGFVERGGPEDGSVLMDIASAQRLTGLEGMYSSVLARARTDGLPDTVSALRARLEGVSEVKTLRQVAYAEESFLGKIELLMALVTLVVLIATSISVSSTMSATVLERMKEIGLMKAIGAKKRDIGGFYIAEGLVIGLIGGSSGYLLGLASAQAVSRGAFKSFIYVPAYILPVSLALGALLAVSSSLLPLAGALRRKPSTMLREE